MILVLALLASPIAEAPPSPLEGSWKTGCAPIGEKGRHGFITTLTVRGDTLAVAAQLYAHADCDTPTVRARYVATIAAVRPRDGAIDVDHVVETIDVTLDAPDVVQLYNAPGSGCGFGGGWQQGVPRKVEGRRCAPFRFPDVGTRLFERGWLDGNRLRLGSLPTAWDNSAAERRPARPGELVFERVG